MSEMPRNQASKSTAHKSTAQRQSSADRRDKVLAAAVSVFAEHGYHAARTADIANRAGISQPYIYALFENKKVLFLAVQTMVHDRTMETFTANWRPSGTTAENLRDLGLAYRALMADSSLLRCQLQGYAASSDPDIRKHMHDLYIDAFDRLVELTGLDTETIARFRAAGMLFNIGDALELPRSYVFAPPVG
jgi:AcrR family transcriptional regulator